MRSLQSAVAAFWPGIPIVPTMSAGASDGTFTSAAGLPTYDVSGVAVEHGDERAHGRDERIGIESFYRGNEFYYRFIKALTAQ